MTSSPSRSSHSAPTAPNHGSNGHSRRVDPDENFPLVLVVDDRQQDVIVFERVLRHHGHRVICTRSYVEAERALSTPDWRFACVVADLKLETEKDGLDVLKLAAERYPACGRVLATADPIGLQLAPHAGGVWFDKHQSGSALIHSVREAIRLARGQLR